MSADLESILSRVAFRDVDAFRAFYDHTRARVFGLVLRVLREPGYSEETVQEVYLQVWRSAKGYDPSLGSALAWVLTIAHRRAVDRVRSEQAGAERESRYGAAMTETSFDMVADEAEARDDRRQVVRCLEALNEAQRHCIELAYYQGLTYHQVSERLSANLATVKSRIRGGLSRLRNCLGGGDYEQA